MKRVAIESFLKGSQNYYSLIIAVSKMARQIVDVSNEIDGRCPDNPVEEAILKIETGEYEIVEDEEF